MKIVELAQVKKDYPLGNTRVRALRGVSFTVEQGELLSIIGPSGSGKTTLLNILGCIDLPSAGWVKIAGQDITTLSDQARTNLRLYQIGFIFQTFNLIPVLNVLENVEFPLLLMKKVMPAEARARATALIEAVGLKAHMLHRPAELSGGQRQRVAIARALVTKPSLVLADEPTANLDSATGACILDLMKRLNEREKTTFIFSTHDPDVLKYAKRIIKLKDGQLVG